MTSVTPRKAGQAMVVLLLATLHTWAGPAKSGELVIEHLDLVAWQPINNSFNTDRGADWQGVLLQFGTYLNDDGAAFHIEWQVRFEDKKGLELATLAKDSFRWINIVAVDPARTAPMTSSHVGGLYPDPGHSTDCSPVDACSVEQCSCASPPCPPTTFAPCLRQRSLHGFFRPSAILTYWHGPNGYALTATQEANPRFGTHTFTFNDPVEITVDGQPIGTAPVARIRILDVGGTTHGLHQSPPWCP